MSIGGRIPQRRRGLPLLGIVLIDKAETFVKSSARGAVGNREQERALESSGPIWP